MSSKACHAERMNETLARDSDEDQAGNPGFNEQAHAHPLILCERAMYWSGLVSEKILEGILSQAKLDGLHDHQEQHGKRSRDIVHCGKNYFIAGHIGKAGHHGSQNKSNLGHQSPGNA